MFLEKNFNCFSLAQLLLSFRFARLSRSRPLTSLHFLRSLRVINGSDPDKKLTILINDNDNLQHLFDWSEDARTNSIAINSPSSAQVLIYYNPRLCPQEVSLLSFKTRKYSGAPYY